MTRAKSSRGAVRQSLHTAFVVALIAGVAPSLYSHRAHAGTNTASIVTTTVKGLPSCLAYQITGVCFFLKCKISGCSIETSIRVSHYVPDAVVSTYNAPAQHPWTDVGRPVAQTLERAGSSIMGFLLDSSANTAREAQEVVTFKSADAIGNPVGSIMAGGGSFEFPDANELANFHSRELPRIMQQWASVPTDMGNGALEGARATAMNPSALLGDAGSLVSQIGATFDNIGNAGQLDIGGVVDSLTSSGSADSMGGPPSYQQLLDQVHGALEQSGITSLNSGGSGFLCPGDAGMLSIHYHSDLDAVFWRGKVPLELLYPASWIPGIGEVGSGLINTWGSTYPRTGELVQSHPVKSSAVLATRVASIIRQEAQPHIYRRLSVNERRYVYSRRGTDPRWQAVYPVPSSQCITFGANDSLLAGSYGDNKTSSDDGYVWNLWLRYECCERKSSIFLFAIP